MIPGLDKMVVCGQGIRDLPLLHDRKGDAICEAPRFIAPLLVDISSPQPQSGIDKDDLHPGRRRNAMTDGLNAGLARALNVSVSTQEVVMRDDPDSIRCL